MGVLLGQGKFSRPFKPHVQVTRTPGLGSVLKFQQNHVAFTRGQVMIPCAYSVMSTYMHGGMADFRCRDPPWGAAPSSPSLARIPNPSFARSPNDVVATQH